MVQQKVVGAKTVEFLGIRGGCWDEFAGNFGLYYGVCGRALYTLPWRSLSS